MSLIVSLRVPDGLVIAADSLATGHQGIDISFKGMTLSCPKCHTIIPGDKLKMPHTSFNIPFSASSYTQKLISIDDKYALSFFGLGVLSNKSIYYHIQLLQKTGKLKDKTLSETADIIIEYFMMELEKNFQDYKTNAPKDWAPIGFHLDGFEDNPDGTDLQEGVTYELHLGKNSEKIRHADIGCTGSGENDIMRKFFQMGENSRDKIRYPLLSLQDAIDLSTFLIDTTSKFQRFGRTIQTVGGNIDVALITPFHGFQWIRRQELMEKLENGKYKVTGA
ncbi:hypothetical protein [uncultured Sphaerochaeta sp.]|uniref:hypothetical protein n=1 Tax=uncultured Sphaerochaeta sp. TaxID=886478 RepID=UPI002A0A7712|nr:hypothetical protein [uncultured Sphaerochaeta sp.]